ncbi:MAG: ribonuclease HI family protein [Streptococcaceae bacterium]|jgi:ribonuclease HI|nr:ribonuclease HI family protein [Streptococcaceae bacterium]
MLKVYIDAAVNEVRSAGGLLVVEAGKQVQKQLELQSLDNHEAEFEMLIYALKWLLAEQKQTENIFIYTDSKAVVLAIDKNYSKNPRLLPYLDQFNQLTTQFHLLLIEWIPEAKNKGADTLAKKKLRRY